MPCCEQGGLGNLTWGGVPVDGSSHTAHDDVTTSHTQLRSDRCYPHMGCNKAEKRRTASVPSWTNTVLWVEAVLRMWVWVASCNQVPFGSHREGNMATLVKSFCSSLGRGNTNRIPDMSPTEGVGFGDNTNLLPGKKNEYARTVMDKIYRKDNHIWIVRIV